MLVAGLPSMNAAEEVLLTNEAAMRAAGFNAYQVKEGICRRGRHRRKDGGPPEECARKHRTDARGHALNAVVEEAWKNKNAISTPLSAASARRAHLTARSYTGISVASFPPAS